MLVNVESIKIYFGLNLALRAKGFDLWVTYLNAGLEKIPISP